MKKLRWHAAMGQAEGEDQGICRVQIQKQQTARQRHCRVKQYRKRKVADPVPEAGARQLLCCWLEMLLDNWSILSERQVWHDMYELGKPLAYVEECTSQIIQNLPPAPLSKNNFPTS